jgi:hypothetical protein
MPARRLPSSSVNRSGSKKPRRTSSRPTAYFVKKKPQKRRARLTLSRILRPRSRIGTLASFVAITTARLRGLAGGADAAIRELRADLAEARRSGYLGYQFLARLALGEVAVKTGKLDEGHAALKALAGEAAAKGFGSIERSRLNPSGCRTPSKPQVRGARHKS